MMIHFLIFEGAIDIKTLIFILDFNKNIKKVYNN